MRVIAPTNRFKKDYKREIKTDAGVTALVAQVVTWLAQDEKLPYRFMDHNLQGAWKGYRECHVKPDLLLIYQKTDAGELHLIRLGSHSELF
jgi:mRNA interferase YafQ